MTKIHHKVMLNKAELAMRGSISLDEVQPGMWGIRGYGVEFIGEKPEYEKYAEARAKSLLVTSTGSTYPLPIWC